MARITDEETKAIAAAAFEDTAPTWRAELHQFACAAARRALYEAGVRAAVAWLEATDDFDLEPGANATVASRLTSALERGDL